MESEKEIILVVRVSTNAQDLVPQVRDLSKFAISKGYVKHHIVEAKESGLADMKDRTGLDKLFSLLESNPKIDAVVATEISRLARRESILHTIKDYFVKHRIQFYIKDSEYCLLDERTRKPKHDGMLFTLYGYFAEEEAARKKDRFARAKKSLMAQGLSISGPTLFGFERKKELGSKSYLIVHEQNAQIIREIYSWYLHGIDNSTPNPSIKRIAQECIYRGYPSYTHSKRNINKTLKEEAYLGQKVTNNKRKNVYKDINQIDDDYIITKNDILYPSQIIDRETFIAVQEKLKSNISSADKSKKVTILSRILRCPVCNNFLTANYRTSKGEKKHSYRCAKRNQPIPCSNKKSYGMEMMDSAVWSLIKLDYPLLSEVIQRLSPDETLSALSVKRQSIETMIQSIDDKVRAFDLMNKKLMSLKSLDLEVQANKMLRSLEKLNREKKSHIAELSSVNLEMEMKLAEINNHVDYVNSNLKLIESSKSQTQNFIRYFIEDIRVLSHNVQFTVLLIQFKYFSNNIKRLDSKVPDSIFDKYTTLFIDKRYTLGIKVYRINKKISITEGGSFSINAKRYSVLKFLDKVKKEKYLDQQFIGVPFVRLNQNSEP